MEHRMTIFLLELLTALIVAIVLSGIFAFASRGSRKRAGTFWLFVLIFMATWAGGSWARPFGPAISGVYWLTFLLVGIVFALILAVFAPRKAPRGRQETLDMLDRIEEEKEIEKVTYITFSAFFWILLFLLILAIIFRYVLGL